MRKLKTLFMALFTAAAVSSVAVMPALAAEGETAAAEGSSTAVTAVTFTKEFISENGGILPDETFTFTMTPDTGENGTNKTSDDLPIKKGLDLGGNATVNLEFGADHDTTQTGTFDFSGLTLEGPAVYRYIVKEVKPEKANKDITYDETSYKIDIMVNNDNTPVAVLNVGAEGSSAIAKKPIVFTNYCATDELVVTKTVTGAMGDKTKAFAFSIDIPAGGDNITLAAGTKIPGTIYRQNGSGDPVEFSVGGTNEFSLADGEKLVISNVPQGMIYTVTETAYDGYQTSIVGTTSSGNTQVTKNVSGNVYNASASGQNTPIVNGGNKIAFTNHKEIIRTGIALDIAPYAVMFLLIVIGGGLALLRARKNQL